MLFLWVLGRALEARLGRWIYGAAYLGIGALANLVFAATRFWPTGFLHVDSGTSLGASGAAWGIAGLHFLLLPESRIRFIMLIPLPRFGRRYRLFRIFAVPTACVLATLLVTGNLLPMVRGARRAAYSAHLAGFAAGILAGWLFLRARRSTPAAGPAPRAPATEPEGGA